MKNVLVSVMLLTILQQPDTPGTSPSQTVPASTGNVFIITTDGLRWQEVFAGADSLLINNEKATPVSELSNMLYWDVTPEARRKKLMPFLWNIIAKKGQLAGNRFYGNKVDVANAYAISYPGYNEIFTGTTDEMISSNKKYRNPNINVLEFLGNKEDFKGKVAAFTSWDVFPYILNEKRNRLNINSGYENGIEYSAGQEVINEVQQEVTDKQATRYDQLTFASAKEYLLAHKPKLFFLGLGETDEFAHDGRYDLYLQQANAVDRMIAELWHWVQTTPGYKDNTTFIITTDHGRGSRTGKWTSHGAFIKGSSEVWLAMIGPGIEPLGELKEKQQLYQRQLAQTIAHLLGENFDPGQPVGEAIALKRKETVLPLPEKDRTVALINDARK